LLDINRVEVAGGMGESDIQFAKTLLSEIGSTAQKTARAFASALHDLHRVVTHAMVGDAQHRATMAMQILDRNLYERANDCRWWALTPSLIQTLQAPGTLDSQAGNTLSRINDLYTVYSGIVLFDAQRRVVATSRAHLHGLLGEVIEEPWVQRALGVEAHRYAVSDWGPTCLQANGATFIYAAAVREPGSQRVLGGIALAWDSTPQLASILRDCAVDSDALDTFVVLQANGQAAAAHGQACSEARLRLAQDATQHLPPGETIADLGGTLFGVGVSQGSGYREFRVHDGYSHGLHAVVLHHLCGRQPQTKDWRGLKVSRTASRAGATGVVRLATFTAGGHWMSVPGEMVRFAAPDTQVLGVAHMRQPMIGMVQLNGLVYPVLDLRCAVLGAQEGEKVSRLADVTRQLVVMRLPVGEGQHADLAVRVDTLTAILEVDGTAMQRFSHPASASGMVDQVVGVELDSSSARPAGEKAAQALLMVLSKSWLQQCVQGAQVSAAFQGLDALVSP
jgi:chemotaxis signal transduction protein